MKKTSLIFLLMAAVLFLFLPAKTHAGDSPSRYEGTRAAENLGFFEDEDVWYIIVKEPKNGKNGEVYAAGSRSSVKKLVIPATVEDSRKKYTVLGINDYAFTGNTDLQTLVIEEGPAYIGERAFSRCSSLSRVGFSQSVNEVGANAFSECDAISSATTPANLKDIPAGMFNNCKGLTKVVIGKNTKNIGSRAFFSCKELKTVKLNSGLKTVGDYAFYSCPLKKVSLSKGLKRIGKGAFEGTKLTSVKLPSTVKKIGEAAFAETKIKEFTLPNKFVIDADFSGEKELTVYVRKRSAAHKALKEFIRQNGLDGWKIGFK